MGHSESVEARVLSGKKYILITANSIYELERQVNYCLNKGFALHGGGYLKHNGSIEFFQPMIIT